MGGYCSLKWEAGGKTKCSKMELWCSHFLSHFRKTTVCHFVGEPIVKNISLTKDSPSCKLGVHVLKPHHLKDEEMEGQGFHDGTLWIHTIAVPRIHNDSFNRHQDGVVYRVILQSTKWFSLWFFKGHQYCSWGLMLPKNDGASIPQVFFIWSSMKEQKLASDV